MAVTKTHQFLPDVFQTETNKKFLNATVDQLISEPQLKQVNGYIGRKLAPSYKATDSYIAESTTGRQDYQLEPSVVIKDQVTNQTSFATTYTDTVNKIEYYGGLKNNHSRLFDNEYYSYDPRVDLDKLINFSQYYWESTGPSAVQITSNLVDLQITYTVTYNPINNAYEFSENGNVPNPSLTLARGGVYEFVINEPGNNFFIQSKPGANGVDPDISNLRTRSVLGVSDNGLSSGTVKFTVPQINAQEVYTNMPTVEVVSYATELAFSQLQGAKPAELISTYGGIDGPVAYLDGATVVFTNRDYIDDAFWTDTTRTVDGVVYFDQSNLIPLADRTNIYTISIVPDSDGNDRILLLNKSSVTNEHKVRIYGGAKNTSKEFFRRNGLYNEVPSITAPLTTIYYQSDKDVDAVGFINLIEPTGSELDPSTDIVGKVNYISPNGVVFTNGMKVNFDSSAPATWQNKDYYVQGVGTGIRLIPSDELISVETIYDSVVAQGGTGYVVGDRVTIQGGTGSESAVAVVDTIKQDTATGTVEFDSSTGTVTSVTIVNGGSGYLTTPTVTFTNSASPASATATLTNGVVTAITIVSSGNYGIDTNIVPTVTISAPTSGVMATFKVKSTGNYSVLPTNPVTVTGGTGAGATLRLFLEPADPDYITINQSSLDRNPWSRANRWVHADVIKSTAQYNNATVEYNQSKRALRPIIEFEADYQLYNSGAVAKAPIDILDTSITRAFQQVQGIVSVDTTVLVVNSTLTLTTGDRVVFASDLDDNVRNKIFEFSIQLAVDEPGDVYKAYLVEASDATVEDGNTTVVLFGENGGKQWKFNGTAWTVAQEKTSTNQEPLYDIIDNNGISFGDLSTYTGSTFVGSKIISYKRGTGANDTALGFPLSYRNIANNGDIEYENNFDNQTFTYILSNGEVQSAQINRGYLQKNVSTTTCNRDNIWQIATTFSKQYKIYDFVFDGVTNIFPVTELPDVSIDFPFIKVYINNKFIESGNFITTKVVDRFAVLVNPDLLTKDDSVFVAIYNKNIPASSDAYYEVPINLDINTLNKNLSSLTLGQIRNHLIALKNNSLNVIGSVPGDSNLRDIVYKDASGSILQHSAPVLYSNLFLNHPTMNFVDATRLANKEYSKFKNKFLETAGKIDIDFNNVQSSVDSIIANMHAVKDSSFPWFHSDMVPHGTDSRNIVPTYTVLDPDIRSYEITSVFNDKVPSNRAVLVYITRTVDNVETKTLLNKGQDYTFSTTRAAITFASNYVLLFNDQIDIVEYSDTDGSFVPETPSKMGMYPKFVPEKYLDNTMRTPINVIQGHDGSLTPAFNDIRDDLLLELERRIYSNIKVDYNENTFNINDYLPGKFRLTDYSRAEFTQILSKNFLSWVGTNRVDFTTNSYFKSSDPFTWNYKLFRDVVNGESLPGTWRSIYRYFYDTDRPHTHPWEMLGFSEKPDYWQDRYGAAPYTGGNSTLWSDLSLGYVHSGDRQGFDQRYARPNLSQFIPVDDNGNLRSPEQILVLDFDSSKANTSFAVGDIGPAELAWRRSSDFPYAVITALALAKPARFFGLQADVHRYTRNSFTGQFEVLTTNQHISPSDINVNGYLDSSVATDVKERSAGYINWITDYVKNLGVNEAAATVHNNLTNLNVQLTYKLGGYTDKRFIELLAEQNSPSSINTSVVIPDDNYRIDLYKGSPLRKITYSGVIVEKSPNGYTVSGYDLNNPFFFIIPSEPNNNSYEVSSNGEVGIIFRDFQKSKFTIPYGFEFNTKQQVVDFLVSYQRYLLSQGFIFDERDDNLLQTRDWILSVKEFLHWSVQGWRQGNIIALSPVATRIRVFDQSAIVDEVKNNPFSSRVLDINFKIVQNSNFSVYRENNLFTFQSNRDQTIAFAEFDLVQYEHLLMVDNTTEFNDVIYVPELGNRQYRLKLTGYKSDGWNGSLELPGFVYSSDKIDIWSGGTDYLKGSIVQNKSQFFTALENITADNDFQTTKWKQIEKSELRSGMIRNFATNSVLGQDFYNVDIQPPNEEVQLFSNGLIGFREREYFTNLGVDVTTQSKFYQGMIAQKGSVNSITALEGAEFGDLNSSIDWYESWGVRVGEYGALDTNLSIDIILAESEVESNPTAIQLTDENVVAQDNAIEITESDILKIEGAYNPNFLRTENNDEFAPLRQLPVAGFVNLEDVDTTLYDLTDFASLTDIVDNIGTGHKIWVARDFNSTWNVYRASYIDGAVFVMRFVEDEIVEVLVNADHGLSADDVIIIRSFDDRFDGVYKVESVVNPSQFRITLYQNLNQMIEESSVAGTGILFKLTSAKIATPADIESVIPLEGWQENDKIWVESYDAEQNWAVYNKTSPWAFNSTVQLDESKYIGNDNFGSSVSLEPDNAQTLYVGAPGSDTGRLSTFSRSTTNSWSLVSSLFSRSTGVDSYGAKVTNGNGYVVVGAPDSSSGKGYVYVYKDSFLQQIITDPSGSASDLFGSSLAMSRDGIYLYVGAPGADKVFCYQLNSRSSALQQLPTSQFTLTLQSSNITVNVGDTITHANAGYMGSASAEVIYSGAYNYTNTNVVVVSGNVAAFLTDSAATSSPFNYAPFTSNIAINGANTSANISTVAVNSATATFSNLSVSSANASDTIVFNQLSAVELIPTIEYSFSGDTITFVTPPAITDAIQLIHRENFYTQISTISGNASTDFGSSLGTNSSGSLVAIGANKSINGTVANDGLAYAYHRTITEFTTDGTSSTYTAPDTFGTDHRVTLDGVELVEGSGYLIVLPSSVQFVSAPGAGSILRVETNNFVQDQIISSNIAGVNGQTFGSDLQVCGTGCNLYVSSPTYFVDRYSAGAVSRLVNVGRVYGNVTGTVSNATVTIGDSIIVNDRFVEFTGTTITDVADNINSKRIPGVTASNALVSISNTTTGETESHWRLQVSSNVQVASERLNIVSGGTGTGLADLGIEIYKHTQVIKHPNNVGERFGTSIGLSQGYSKLAIGSDGADITTPTTFDLYVNNNATVGLSNRETIFDSLSTKFTALVRDSGAIYMYDQLPSHQESEEFPALFAFSQKLTGPDLETGYNFGAAVDIVNDIMVVGVTNDANVVTGGGSVYSYYNSNSQAGWDLLRYKEPRVAVDAVNSVFLYNNETQVISNYLDSLDPAKGKLLGLVDQELDYIEQFDPATYNQVSGTSGASILNSSYYWSTKYIGKTWWDVTKASFIDYEQGNLTYRSNNWGKLFPGSEVIIYEWVESDVLPSQYVDSGQDGTPKHTDDSAYTQITLVDPATGIIVTKFYFWVSGKVSVDPNTALRTLSTTTLEEFIENPKDQNVPYIGTLATNSLNLYNVNDKLTGNNVILHVDHSTVTQVHNGLIHNEFELVEQGDSTSVVPARVVSKIRDSLQGLDVNGKLIPDLSLKAGDRIGILNTPRQSVFVNRITALKEYIVKVNEILIQHPVLLTTNPTDLYAEEALPLVFDAQVTSFVELSYIDTSDFADGYLILIPSDTRYSGRWTLFEFNGVTQEFDLVRIQAFKTSLAWTSTNWYSTSYVTGKEINHTVNTFNDIQKLSIAADEYIKVLDDGSGRFLIYEVGTTGTLTLIAAENSTVEFSSSLYDVNNEYGFDTTVFDSEALDNQASVEIGKLFDAVQNQILIDDLAIESNNLFFALVNYILQEQKSPDWIFKTSFIAVYHALRTLDQIPVYSRDNQSFYEEYINEIKPYRTQLKEFIPVYTKTDTATGSWTDFDIPARWYADENIFRSPNIQVTSDSTYFATDLYKPYADNYKLEVGEIIIGNVGQNYTLAPNIEISGGGGTGANAIATISAANGTISSITIVSPGSGYTTTPSVTINGTGEGATAYAVLSSEFDSQGSYNTVRSIDSTIKFDRITYASNVTAWAANVAYEDTIVVNGNFANSYDLNRIELDGNANVAPQDATVTDVYFKPDGTKMYVAGDTTDRVYEYTLSTPWEVTTASNVSFANVAPQDSSVQGLFFREDGYRLYAIGDTSNSVYEYRLATPWSVNTAANISVVSINSQETSATAVELSTDGTRMYVLGTANDTVFEYELSIPWLASSATYSTRSKSVASEENTPTGMRFREDGKELFVTGQQYNKVWSYTLSTAWDISTATLNNSADLDATNPTGMYMRHDGTRLFVADDAGNYVQQYDFNSNGITQIDGNLYITSGNIIFYNNTAYLATNANVSSESVFDFTRFTEINSGNVLLSAADRITSYYVPEFGKTSKDINQLMFGAGYPGNKVQGMDFGANSFTLTSNVIGFNYTGHKITSANIQQVDFVDRGFNLNDPIRIEGMYDNFNFENNATFKVVSISRDEMMLSGQPIESIVTLSLGGSISANEGDYITQSNSTANARVLNNYTSTTEIAVIQEKQGWNELDANVVSVNGVATTANVMDVLSSGTGNIKISNLYIDDILDSNIASFYTDTALGTRPEDINIVGGFFLDAYNSHAPEELIPGRMYDTLEMRVFTNTASNTASYGFRVFEPMDSDREYYRISANNTTALSANLAIDDVNMFVDNAAKLPDPGTGVGGAPGEVFINGELIYYYQKYDQDKILTADVWTANTEFDTDSLITFNSNVYLVLGNVYANANAYIDSTSIKQVYLNSLSQLRRGVDGTGANAHTTDDRVVDSSLAQQLPNTAITSTSTLTGQKKVAANVTWRVGLNNTISANIGDYMTMTSPTANVRILETVANANVVAVDFVDGNLRIANANVSINGTTTTANVTTLNILGEVLSTGNVSVTGKTIKQDYLWKAYGTGDTLDSSTTEWAEYIKEERSYTP